MEFEYTDKLSFFAEWYDHESAYRKKFILNYFPSDNTLELFDRELNRVYLKRTKMDELDMGDVFVGNTIRIYGRQVKISDYADERTRRIVGRSKEHTFVIIKPSLILKLGEVITEIQRRRFQICKMKMCQLSRKEVLDLYKPYEDENLLPFYLDHLVSGPVIALELVGDNAIQRLMDELGPRDPAEGKRTAPQSLRAIYCNDNVHNGFHAASNPTSVRSESDFFFAAKTAPQMPLKLRNTTCCVVKPHAMLQGNLGPILQSMTDAKFRVVALQMFYLSSAAADEFLEVYKGVVGDYHALLLSFVDGPCVALEVAGQTDDVDAHMDFRRFCGPSDPDIARQIRPGTLRAKFGCDRYKNAVHCTDLPEDTTLEIEYFFKILAR